MQAIPEHSKSETNENDLEEGEICDSDDDGQSCEQADENGPTAVNGEMPTTSVFNIFVSKCKSSATDDLPTAWKTWIKAIERPRAQRRKSAISVETATPEKVARVERAEISTNNRCSDENGPQDDNQARNCSDIVRKPGYTYNSNICRGTKPINLSSKDHRRMKDMKVERQRSTNEHATPNRHCRVMHDNNAHLIKCFDSDVAAERAFTRMSCRSCGNNLNKLLTATLGQRVVKRTDCLPPIEVETYVIAKDDDWQYPIIAAARLGHLHCVELLLKNGAIPEISNADGENALSVAVEQYDFAVVHLLVDWIEPKRMTTKVSFVDYIKKLIRSDSEHVRKLVSKGFIKGDSETASVAMFAFRHGYEDMAYTAIRQIDVTNLGRLLSTSLHYCVKHDWDELLCWLLDHGVDINGFKDGRTALYHACEDKKYDLMDLLLSRNADPNAADDTEMLIDESYNKLLPIQIAVTNGDELAVNKLINYGAVIVPTANNEKVNQILNSFPPLYQTAFKSGFPQLARYLIKRATDKSNETVLHRAVRDTRQDDVWQLLAYGADSNQLNARQESALHIAVEAEQRHDESQRQSILMIVKLLLQSGADPNIACQVGETPLYKAIKMQNTQVVEELLRHTNESSLNDCTCDKYPLILSCKLGNEAITKMLLKKGADANVSTVPGAFRGLQFYGQNMSWHLPIAMYHGGLNALFVAVSYGHDNIVGHLLNYGADVTQCDGYNRTLFDLICHADFFISSYPLGEWLRQNPGIRSALIQGSHSGWVGIWKNFLEIRKSCTADSDVEQSRHLNCLIQILMAYSFVSCSSKSNIENLLFTAADAGYSGVVGMIVRSRNVVDVHWRNVRKETALHLAGNVAVAQRLLEAGADINAVDDQGMTPLHKAISRCKYKSRVEQAVQVEVIKVLLESKANVNALTQDKKTPLYLACAIDGLKEVAKLLLKYGADKALTLRGNRSNIGDRVKDYQELERNFCHVSGSNRSSSRLDDRCQFGAAEDCGIKGREGVVLVRDNKKEMERGIESFLKNLRSNAEAVF